MAEVARTQSQETPVSFKLEKEIVKQIDEISKRECRSRSGTVRLALIAYIEANRPNAGKKGGARNGR